MKTLVAHSDTAIKIALEMNGKLTATIPGGEKFEGQCTPEECEVLAFRLNAASKGKISFEPAPADFFSTHRANIETLEKQAFALNELRETLEEAKSSIGETVIENAQLEERIKIAEEEVSAARSALKDARIEISLLNERIEALDKAALALEVSPSVLVPEKQEPETPGEFDHTPSGVPQGQETDAVIESKPIAADFSDVESEGLAEVKLDGVAPRDTEPPSAPVEFESSVHNELLEDTRRGEHPSEEAMPLF